MISSVKKIVGGEKDADVHDSGMTLNVFGTAVTYFEVKVIWDSQKYIASLE
jgi:hypothetical protein